MLRSSWMISSIDIAVDLEGLHPGVLVPAILAHRPAPIQVSYLGYPGTHGRGFHGLFHRRRDRRAVRVGSRIYTEKIVHLPDCYQRQRFEAARSRTRYTDPARRPELPDRRIRLLLLQQQLQDHRAHCSTSGCGSWPRSPGSVLWLLQGQRRGASQSAQAGCRARRSTRPGWCLRRPRRASTAHLGPSSPGRSLPGYAALQRPYHGERCPVGGLAGP